MPESPRPEAIPALAREQFPALMADPGVVYLDSAATTQKPRPVIDAVTAELAGPDREPRARFLSLVGPRGSADHRGPRAHSPVLARPG